MVDVPASPSMRITPNDVNVKTNTIDAAARIAGRSSGSVISGDPPRDGAQRGGRRLEVGGKVLPHRTDGAHDDGEVEEHVGDEDRRRCRALQGGEQGEDGRAHDDGRQDEGGGEQPGEQPSPRKRYRAIT